MRQYQHDSEIGILMVVYENFYFNSFKCFKELRKCVAKLYYGKILADMEIRTMWRLLNNIEFFETFEKLIFSLTSPL